MGLYTLRSTYPDTVMVEDFMMVWDADTPRSLTSHVVQATTDEAGNFLIVQDCMAFDHELYIAPLDSTITISRWVHILVVDHQDRTVISDSVYVDAEIGAEITVRLP